jgi:hypothetical protein
MFSPSQTGPCRGFPVAVLFPDVEPEVLAREAANEARRASRTGAGAWHAYLRRVLPAMERSAAGDMAQALLTTGSGPHAARAHARRVRRRVIAAGAAHRARFWADVATEVGRVSRS